MFLFCKLLSFKDNEINIFIDDIFNRVGED